MFDHLDHTDYSDPQVSTYSNEVYTNTASNATATLTGNSHHLSVLVEDGYGKTHAYDFLCDGGDLPKCDDVIDDQHLFFNSSSSFAIYQNNREVVIYTK